MRPFQGPVLFLSLWIVLFLPEQILCVHWKTSAADIHAIANAKHYLFGETLETFVPPNLSAFLSGIDNTRNHDADYTEKSVDTCSLSSDKRRLDIGRAVFLRQCKPLTLCYYRDKVYNYNSCDIGSSLNVFAQERVRKTFASECLPVTECISHHVELVTCFIWMFSVTASVVLLGLQIETGTVYRYCRIYWVLFSLAYLIITLFLLSDASSLFQNNSVAHVYAAIRHFCFLMKETFQPKHKHDTDIHTNLIHSPTAEVFQSCQTNTSLGNDNHSVNTLDSRETFVKDHEKETGSPGEVPPGKSPSTSGQSTSRAGHNSRAARCPGHVTREIMTAGGGWPISLALSVLPGSLAPRNMATESGGNASSFNTAEGDFPLTLAQEGQSAASPALEQTTHSSIDGEEETFLLPDFDWPLNLRHMLYKREDGNSSRVMETINCRLHLVADQLFYQNVGGGNEAETARAMRDAVRGADALFRSTDFNWDGIGDNVGFEVAKVTVIKSRKQSFLPANHDNDHMNYLRNFSLTDQSAFCLAVAFTYIDFKGGVGGVSWIGSSSHEATPGGICQPQVYVNRQKALFSFNTLVITYLVHGARASLDFVVRTLTHELGHSFGSQHDMRSGSDCRSDYDNDGGTYLMNHYSTSGSMPNNRRFSPCSRRVMFPVIVRKGACLQRLLDTTCGNGVVEEDEECDCGTNATCPLYDPCCTPSDVGSDSPDPPCTLRRSRGSVCSVVDSPCCTSDCTIVVPLNGSVRQCRGEGQCSHSSYCDGQNAVCPAPRYKGNGTRCAGGTKFCEEGACEDSVCRLHGHVECLCEREPADKCKLCCWSSEGTEAGDCVPAADLGILNKDGSPIYLLANAVCRYEKEFYGFCKRHICIVHEDPSPPPPAPEEEEEVEAAMNFFALWLENYFYYFPQLVGWLVAGVVYFQCCCRHQLKSSHMTALRYAKVLALFTVESEADRGFEDNIEMTGLVLERLIEKLIQEKVPRLFPEAVGRMCAFFPSCPPSRITLLVLNCTSEDVVVRILLAQGFPARRFTVTPAAGPPVLQRREAVHKARLLEDLRDLKGWRRRPTVLYRESLVESLSDFVLSSSSESLAEFEDISEEEEESEVDLPESAVDRGSESLEEAEVCVDEVPGTPPDKSLPPPEEPLSPPEEPLPPPEEPLPPPEEPLPPPEEPLPPPEEPLPPLEEPLPPPEEPAVAVPPPEESVSPEESSVLVPLPVESYVPPEEPISPEESSRPPAEPVSPPEEPTPMPEEPIPPSEEPVPPAEEPRRKFESKSTSITGLIEPHEFFDIALAKATEICLDPLKAEQKPKQSLLDKVRESVLDTFCSSSSSAESSPSSYESSASSVEKSEAGEETSGWFSGLLLPDTRPDTAKPAPAPTPSGPRKPEEEKKPAAGVNKEAQVENDLRALNWFQGLFSSEHLLDLEVTTSPSDSSSGEVERSAFVF